ncbi:hypothetical protein H6F42_21060 [Pseudanabaena sp. FACHB-1998]|uniref:hypothetical protein n=1 Tax=Pseudanabaena sp. FACHB-1998 TaxID=2692858 RepID=UPI001680CF16|nr:hypothetical protein [Pseudanabaena sp. FACHB-1998]MBD2179411.1 hypothetical protein [Pseudanabaena sp. FACHB-1998]
MDPLTILMAIAGLVTSGALTKVGENVTDSFVTFIVKSKHLLDEIQKKSPSTAIAIQNANQQPLDYGQAYIDIETVSKNDQDMKKLLQEMRELIESNETIAKEVEQEINTPNFQVTSSTIIENWKGINVKGGNNTIIGNTFNF